MNNQPDRGAVFEENREKLWRIAYRNRPPKASAVTVDNG
jgi:hypothetical protein